MKKHISLTKSTGNPRVDRALDEIRRKINPVLNSMKDVEDYQASHVGEFKMTELTEAQFINKYGPEWVLCDGGNVSTGSEYYKIIGSATVPDLSAHIAGINYFVKVN